MAEPILTNPDEPLAIASAVNEWKSACCLYCGAKFSNEADAGRHQQGPCGFNVIDLYDGRSVN